MPGVNEAANRTTESWPKVILDPIHNMIVFNDDPTGKLLFDLLNCREIQRLRRIKQLGLSELVFPGANHSRFAHSIGVMHITKLFLDRIEKVNRIEKVSRPLNAEQKKVILAAALLHDVGHGPFSHTFEKITNNRHESRTEQIILDDSTEVNQVLRKDDEELPERITGFFRQDPASAFVPAYCAHIVSSQLDADRFDYLLRDSHATGADYGRFDHRWLIDHVHVDESCNRVYLGKKAFYATEQYIFGRYHMYQAVYFHKTTRAAEVMLRLVFRRYRELLGAESTSEARAKVVENVAPALTKAFMREIDLEDFLLLDDHTITEFLKSCGKCKDSILKRLAEGLLNRRLYKCVDATYVRGDQVAQFSAKAKEIGKKYVGDENYGLEPDAAEDTPYQPYDPSDENPATQIFVEDWASRVKPIDHLSDQVNALRKTITKLRYYFPEEARYEIVKLTRSWKGGIET